MYVQLLGSMASRICKHVGIAVIIMMTPLLADKLSFTVVFNNVASDKHLATEWGMACVIQGTEKTILFDTGSDGQILIKNMELLGYEPAEIDYVFISHAHWDHTGGLHDFLDENNDVTIFVPSSAPDELTSSINEQGAQFIPVAEQTKICSNVYSTGEMKGMGVAEQALVIDTNDGLIVITGCAHPGVVNIAARAKEISDQQITLLFGGFHLIKHSDEEIERIITELRKFGVRRVGPSHCTGDRAIALFKAAWKDDFIDLGCGARFELKMQ